MESSLRVLVVDDSPDDVELLIQSLIRSGFEPVWRRVDTAAALEGALLNETWDIMISDWSMPHFSAPAAFAIMRAHKLDLPFIIVSGTVGEEVAVEALRAGAHDFVVKDRLTRLAPAIERERREAKLRQEQRKLQDQLLLADRMASVGLLAAGVAHELSSPLMCVAANVKYAQDHLLRLANEGVACGELQLELTDASEAIDRIAQLVRDLKVFCRGEDDARAAVDLRNCLDFAVRMAAPEIRHRARLVKDYRDVPLIDANEARLGQVLLNLLVNAAQSIDGDRPDANEIRVVTLTDASGRAVVEVHDTGCGIPQELVGQLFTPFVTTKPVGVGTGLGLWICHWIITALDGEISLDSHVGKGTSFRITLPAAHSGGAIRGRTF
ncbi:MAG TPA: ATP-binding protein [Polyangiales bacterium]|jgi:C4-dicarboxylate-specific signal transduction histidine kinase